MLGLIFLFCIYISVNFATIGPYVQVRVHPVCKVGGSCGVSQCEIDVLLDTFYFQDQLLPIIKTTNCQNWTVINNIQTQTTVYVSIDQSINLCFLMEVYFLGRASALRIVLLLIHGFAINHAKNSATLLLERFIMQVCILF